MVKALFLSAVYSVWHLAPKYHQVKSCSRVQPCTTHGTHVPPPLKEKQNKMFFGWFWISKSTALKPDTTVSMITDFYISFNNYLENIKTATDKKTALKNRHRINTKIFTITFKSHQVGKVLKKPRKYFLLFTFFLHVGTVSYSAVNTSMVQTTITTVCHGILPPMSSGPLWRLWKTQLCRPRLWGWYHWLLFTVSSHSIYERLDSIFVSLPLTDHSQHDIL